VSARGPEDKLLALTHLTGFRRAPALGSSARLSASPSPPPEIVAKRQTYVQRGLAVLRELDPHGRSGDDLLSATNLLLGMLNGIARRPFLESSEDVRTLATTVGALFLYGFLERAAVGGAASAASLGDHHDA
jgi:hypothetical protein